MPYSKFLLAHSLETAFFFPLNCLVCWSCRLQPQFLNRAITTVVLDQSLSLFSIYCLYFQEKHKSFTICVYLQYSYIYMVHIKNANCISIIIIIVYTCEGTILAKPQIPFMIMTHWLVFCIPCKLPPEGLYLYTFLT